MGSTWRLLCSSFVGSLLWSPILRTCRCTTKKELHWSLQVELQGFLSGPPHLQLPSTGVGAAAGIAFGGSISSLSKLKLPRGKPRSPRQESMEYLPGPPNMPKRMDPILPISAYNLCFGILGQYFGILDHHFGHFWRSRLTPKVCSIMAVLALCRGCGP